MTQLAIQRFIRDDKGNAKVVLIDALTLQPVTNPSGYEIINQTETPWWEPVQDVSQPDVPSRIQPPAAILNNYINQSGGDPTHPAVKSAVQTHTATTSPATAAVKGSVGVKAGVGAPQSSAPNITVSPADVQKAEAASGAPSAPTVSGEAPSTPSPTGLGTSSTRSRSPNPNTTVSDPAAPAKADISVEAPTKSGGFAALTEHLGPGRPNMPTGDIVDKVREAAAKAYGPGTTVDITSGMEDPGKDYSGNNRHPQGKAMDFSITRPDGTKVTAASADAKNFAETAKTMGVTGVGFGADYMGGNHFHMDTVDLGTLKPGADNEWGNLGNAWKTDLTSAGYLGATSAERAQPHGIPQARPETVSKGIIGQAKDVTQSSIQGDPSKVSPAQIAGMGLMTHPRTPDEISRMASVFAGELGPSTLEGLAKGDETAKKELAGMVSTAENRVSTAKSFDAVFDPSQYNSMMKDNQSVTKGNYAKYGAALRENIAGFYTGAVKPENYDVTNYYNPSISNPAWGTKNKTSYGLLGAQQVGEHTFGSVRDRMGYKSTDLSGGANRPTEGSGHFGLGGLGRGLDSPSEGGSRFGGKGLGGNDYSGKGGMDSPSESGSRFGGSGLGQGTSSKSSSHTSDKDKDRSADGRAGAGGFGNYSGGGEKV